MELVTHDRNIWRQGFLPSVDGITCMNQTAIALLNDQMNTNNKPCSSPCTFLSHSVKVPVADTSLPGVSSPWKVCPDGKTPQRALTRAMSTKLHTEAVFKISVLSQTIFRYQTDGGPVASWGEG